MLTLEAVRTNVCFDTLCNFYNLQAADLLLQRMKDAKFNFSQVAALSGTAQV